MFIVWSGTDILLLSGTRAFPCCKITVCLFLLLARISVVCSSLHFLPLIFNSHLERFIGGVGLLRFSNYCYCCTIFLCHYFLCLGVQFYPSVQGVFWQVLLEFVEGFDGETLHSLRLGVELIGCLPLIRPVLGGIGMSTCKEE